MDNTSQNINTERDDSPESYDIESFTAYKSTFFIDSNLLHNLYGRTQQIKKRIIEKEVNVKVDQESDPAKVIIKGFNKESVIAARQEIDIIIEENSLRQREDNSNIYEVLYLGNGKYQLSCKIQDYFVPHIIGVTGSTRQRIQDETETIIELTNTSIGNNCHIYGPTRENVILAKQKIDLSIKQGRRYIKFTHFLSIPIHDENIRDNFLKFKEDILNHHDIRDIEPQFFQKSYQLHYPLEVFKLFDDRAIDRAVQTLQDCRKDIEAFLENNGKIEVELSGLEHKPDNLMNAKVIYVKAKSDTLNEVISIITNRFIERGLLRMRTKPFDVTLISSKYVDTTRQKRHYYNTFNAAPIIKDFGSYSFGKFNVTEIHLSSRAERTGKYYYAEGILKL